MVYVCPFNQNYWYICHAQIQSHLVACDMLQFLPTQLRLIDHFYESRLVLDDSLVNRHTKNLVVFDRGATVIDFWKYTNFRNQSRNLHLYRTYQVRSNKLPA